MILKTIVAYGTNGVIGKDNDLIWHLPDDLKHFKKLGIALAVVPYLTADI
jgi:dihydrofolate reductase